MHAKERPEENAGQRRVPDPPRQMAAAAQPSLGTGSAPGVAALQRTAGNAAVARMIEERRRGTSGGREPAVQRSAVHDVLRSAGQPLDEPLRAEMEARLGADFSDVRLHTGAAAQRSAAEVGARAFTSGNHVVLGAGGHDRHTLAHELTHVLQQREGPVTGTDNGGGLRISEPGDRFEREAEANARRVLGMPAPQHPAATDPAAESPPGSGAGGSAVQRMPAPTPGGYWFDASTRTWQTAPVDPLRLRQARPEERLRAADATSQYLRLGYASPDEVPVYVARTFRQTRPSGHGDQDAGLRAGNRVARITHRAVTEGRSPHVASTVMPDGSLGLAGNTGAANVTGNDAAEMNEALWEPFSTSEDNRRQRRDAVKYAALVSGHYGQAHPDAPSLAGWTRAVHHARAHGADYSSSELDVRDSGSQHGELSLLGAHVRSWMENGPAPEGSPLKTVQMGGVKRACAACQWAYEATNRHIAARYGYRVVSAGSHGQLFNRWIMPDWLEENEPARKEIITRAAEAGGLFKRNRQGYLELRLDERSANAVHGMPHSESEWEED